MAIITEEVGDIFDSPSNTILIHACNAKGVWGSGVAVEFKKRSPKAYQIYHAHCLAHKTSLVDGTTLLIPPQSSGISKNQTWNKDSHYIACLFTSHGYGKTVDPPETILTNTKAALDDLASQIDKLKADTPGIELGGCRAVRINSGKFGVPWEKTKKILEEGLLDMIVVRPEDEENEKGNLGKRSRTGQKKGGIDGETAEKAGNRSKEAQKGQQLKIKDVFKQPQDDTNAEGDSGDDLPSKRRRGSRPYTGK